MDFTEWFWGDCTYCYWITESFMLGSKNDGATDAKKLGALKFGNAYSGNAASGFCHINDMNFGPEYLNGELLGLFDTQAQRSCRVQESC